MSAPELHSAIVAMVSLAAGIAANHPAMGQCQLGRLRAAGVPESQIGTVIEIARHIRDEAAETLDHRFDGAKSDQPTPVEGEACCTPTKSGQSCC